MKKNDSLSNNDYILGQYDRIIRRRILRNNVYTPNHENVSNKTCPRSFYLHTTDGYSCFWIDIHTCMSNMVSFFDYWLWYFHYHSRIDASLQIKVGLTITCLNLRDNNTCIPLFTEGQISNLLFIGLKITALL